MGQLSVRSTSPANKLLDAHSIEISMMNSEVNILHIEDVHQDRD